jgi:hypothetical protein
MAVAFIMDFPGGTLEQYDAVVEKMDLGGRLPPGGLYHAAGAIDDGVRVCDVWESEEIFQQFAESKIGPLTAEVGLGEPEIRSFEVDQTRSGGSAPVEFVQVITIPGTTAEDFHALDGAVLGPSGEVPDECVYHVNGAFGDSYVVLDYWSSKAARDEFMQTRVGPAMQAAGVAAQPSIEELSVHNSLTEPATARV